MSDLEILKHVAYTRRCLNLLPAAFASNDLNRLSLGFFLLNTLDLLDKLSTIRPEERDNWINWIYHCQVTTGGFRGSPATKTEEPSVFDAGHLPALYFTIASLLILEDDLTRLDRKGALETLRRLQNEDGSFSPVLIGDEKFGEVDVRHLYCAIATWEMLSPVKPEEDINVPAAVKYIQQCKVKDQFECANGRVTMAAMHRAPAWSLMVSSYL
jgi:geranylgeranyl transferase type-1 subunit beta